MAAVVHDLRVLEVVWGELESLAAQPLPGHRGITKRRRVVACIIWALSQSIALCEAYLLSTCHTGMGSSGADWSPRRSLLTLVGWLELDHTDIVAALVDPENPRRVEADCFLVRSLTALVVHVQCLKGVVVSTAESVYHYLRFWSLRPMPDVLRPILRKLTYDRNSRRKFGQLLRREWMLEYGSHRLAAELPEDETNRRAIIKETVWSIRLIIQFGCLM
jgi:hypothetical protein